MIKEIVITFIYAKECPDCAEMNDTLNLAIRDSSACNCCKIHKIDSDSDEAIDIAIENDIDDIPSCIIGEKIFVGKDNYSYDSMLKAIDEVWSNL